MTPEELGALDAAIVRAAEEWEEAVKRSPGMNRVNSKSETLLRAVAAKREALKPAVFCLKCGEAATLEIAFPLDRSFYCDEHKPEVVEL